MVPYRHHDRHPSLRVATLPGIMTAPHRHDDRADVGRAIDAAAQLRRG
jgi:hypothetical protein